MITEIENINEFEYYLKKFKPETFNLKGCVLHGIDFNKGRISEEIWNNINFQGASFWDCIFPAFTISEKMRSRGAVITEQPEDLPFLIFKNTMYSQEDLERNDKNIYEFYLNRFDINSLYYESVHDYSLRDALYDYLENKTVVVIMGGHGVKRASVMYNKIAEISRTLARNGIVVATGGGPGAME